MLEIFWYRGRFGHAGWVVNWSVVFVQAIQFRRPVEKPTNISKPTTVSEHFLNDHHTANYVSLNPLKIIHSDRDSVHKAREACLINVTRGNTVKPLG